MTHDDALDRARHDLGRYVAFQTRWVGVDGPVDDLREALVADLRRTRSGPGGVEGVGTVWARVRVATSGVEAVDVLVARLAAFDPETADEPALRAAAADALACATAVRALG